MKKLVILYATGEGHTVTISQELKATAERLHFDVDLFHVEELPTKFHLELYDGILLAASVHLGQFQKSMTSFVKTHLEVLEHLPSAFLSVSLSEASHAQEDKLAISENILTFLEETGWHPVQIKSVAGALLYQEYGMIKRWLVRWIAEKKGLSTDTGSNMIYTNWDSLEQFAEDFLRLVSNQAGKEDKLSG